MLDDQSRQQKASKILAVVRHFLGVDDLTGFDALDVGCSAGIIAHELHRAGAAVMGVDIDRPGVERARARFAAEGLTFLEYDGNLLPGRDHSMDLIVYNHVYEHTVDPDRLMSEIRRVLAPGGVVYLGLGNRYGVMEPHHHLPFLSWLPQGAADRYLQTAGRGDHYYERFKTRRQLKRMCAGLAVWDYTYAVLAQPERFGASDMVKGRLRSVPSWVWWALTPVIPTYIWVGTEPNRVRSGPAGPALRVAPTRLTS